MYGIIHKAMQSFVVKTRGPETWSRIAAACGFEDQHTLSSVHFEDKHTIALGQAAANELGVSLGEVLYPVGVYWTEFAKAEGYGALFDMAGDTLPEFLSNLNRMHGSLKITLTEAVMPSFKLLKESPGRYEVFYSSPRKNMEPFVKGLLEGLAGTHFREPADVTYEMQDGGALFTLVSKVRELPVHERFQPDTPTSQPRVAAG
jgi:hypothetical protein